MALYRNVHINFWEDTKVLDDMDIEERYFMLYLLTNPHSNQVGCFEISKKQMISETGFKKEKINQLLQKFEKDLKIITYCNTTKELYIKNWYKYNWNKSPKVKSCIEKEFSNIKSEDLKKELSKTLMKVYGIDSICIDYEYTINRPCIDICIKEEEEEEEEEEQEKEKEEEVAKATSPALIFNFSSIFDYGKQKNVSKSYCKKFFDYYVSKGKKWKSDKEWKNKFDEWVEKDNVENDTTELVKVDDGVFKI